MITAVTTCMGRREHLEVTLPFMLEAFDKVIVVDWSCPQESGQWAASEGASVAYKYGEKHFNAGKARNHGAKLVTTEYIVFVDADVMCMPWLKDEFSKLLSAKRMLLSSRDIEGYDVNDTVGFVACRTDAFWNVGGYSESWKGWGSEDIQLRGKLLLDEKLEVVRVSSMALGAIAHSNELRGQYREIPVSESAIANFLLLKEWFATKGIENFPFHPAVKDINVIGRG